MKRCTLTLFTINLTILLSIGIGAYATPFPAAPAANSAQVTMAIPAFTDTSGSSTFALAKNTPETTTAPATAELAVRASENAYLTTVGAQSCDTKTANDTIIFGVQYAATVPTDKGKVMAFRDVRAVAGYTVIAEKNAAAPKISVI